MTNKKFFLNIYLPLISSLIIIIVGLYFYNTPNPDYSIREPEALIADDIAADMVFTVVEDNIPELFRIVTIYHEDGIYTVQVHYSEGVTPDEAAKEFFDYLTQHECNEGAK